jgi:hypothetical protein
MPYQPDGSYEPLIVFVNAQSSSPVLVSGQTTSGPPALAGLGSYGWKRLRAAG